MSIEPQDRLAALLRAFGRKKPPETITQEAFDFDAGHLRRLAQLRPGESAEARDLWDYTQDLRYTEVQLPWVEYLLPSCLAAWRQDLRGTHGGYGGFIGEFYPALADKVLRLLNSHQTAAVSEFMRQAILEEIDDQRGLAYKGKGARPYRWIAALASYGVLLGDADRLWTEWWKLTTVGRGIAAVQYASCLMYPENENPVFSAWTRDAGGGPPCLWEFEGAIYTHCWLDENVDFLKKFLKVNAVGKVLERAVERLLNEPEFSAASQVFADLPLCAETVEARCAELPRLLETKGPDKPLSWSR
jgi:hypothetical protein